MKGKYVLYLKEIIPLEVLKKYGFIEEDFEIFDTFKPQIKNKTFQLNPPKGDPVKYHINMYDYVKDVFMPPYTSIPCWWCRETFDSQPYGIPIKYCCEEDDYDRKYILEKLRFLNIKVGEDYKCFFTDGIVCSFPCMKSFIIKNISNKKYVNALTNMTLLMYVVYGQYIPIKAAPSWKVMKKWGGSLSLEEYKESISIYKETINICYPYMFPVGTLIEEVK